MSLPADLDDRLRLFEEMEAIKRLKYRYWRFMDAKRWGEFAGCFTKDVVVEISTFMTFQSSAAFVQHVKKRLGQDFMISVHHGHNPDIDIIDGRNARGTWSFRDNIVDSRANTAVKGWGVYEDEYTKETDGWKIKSTKVNYRFTEYWEHGRAPEIAPGAKFIEPLTE